MRAYLIVTMRAPNHSGVPKSPNDDISTFLNTVDMLPKDISFEHRGTELAACPRRHL